MPANATKTDGDNNGEMRFLIEFSYEIYTENKNFFLHYFLNFYLSHSI